jgi:bifunctional non-homologous end joining protein LigD
MIRARGGVGSCYGRRITPLPAALTRRQDRRRLRHPGRERAGEAEARQAKVLTAHSAAWRDLGRGGGDVASIWLFLIAGRAGKWDGMTPRSDGYIPPCIPTHAYKVPAGPEWVHEIKHDGYRLQVRRDGDIVRLFTRRGYDWTERYPAIAGRAGMLQARSFTVDGEAVVANENGIAVFDRLHRRHKVTDAMMYAFDLLELNGEDLRSLPLVDRKAKLAKLLARSRSGIVFNDHTDEDGIVIFQHACKMGLEGIVSKRLSAPYRSGPSKDWIKVKNPDGPAMVRHHEERW